MKSFISLCSCPLLLQTYCGPFCLPVCAKVVDEIPQRLSIFDRKLIKVVQQMVLTWSGHNVWASGKMNWTWQDSCVRWPEFRQLLGEKLHSFRTVLEIKLWSSYVGHSPLLEHIFDNKKNKPLNIAGVSMVNTKTSSSTPTPVARCFLCQQLWLFGKKKKQEEECLSFFFPWWKWWEQRLQKHLTQSRKDVPCCRWALCSEAVKTSERQRPQACGEV